MNFKEKIRNLTAPEIIRAMVEGLKNPAVKIQMATFGTVANGVCYGCAATATIAHLMGIEKTTPKMWDLEGEFLYSPIADQIGWNWIQTGWVELEDLEDAIDYLRRVIWIDSIKYYNPISGLLLFAFSITDSRC